MSAAITQLRERLHASNNVTRTTVRDVYLAAYLTAANDMEELLIKRGVSKDTAKDLSDVLRGRVEYVLANS